MNQTNQKRSTETEKDMDYANGAPERTRKTRNSTKKMTAEADPGDCRGAQVTGRSRWSSGDRCSNYTK